MKKNLVIFFLFIIHVYSVPVISQPPSREQKTVQNPSQAQIQAQIKQARNEAQQQITELENDIAEAKKNNEDPETIKELESQLATMKKMLGVVDKATSLSGRRPKTPDVPTTTIAAYQSPFIRILKQPVTAPTEAQAKDRLLWYRGKKLNDSTLITTRARIVRYSRKKNMVIVQPDEKKDTTLMNIVNNLSKSRQWTKNYINKVSALKNSFFDYPQTMMTLKEFDYIEKEFNKLADNTIKLPGPETNLMASAIHLHVTGRGGASIHYDISLEDTFNLDDWVQQMHQKILNLMNNPPPLDFPPPPRHEFDLCYYCDTSMEGKYYRDKDAWSEKFTEYEAKIISTVLAIYHEYAILGGDISDSKIPNLEHDIERASYFAQRRLEQKVDLLKQRYMNDVYRQEAVVTMILSQEREQALLGFTDDLPPASDLSFLIHFDDYLRQEIAAKNYNIIFNYALILGHERQKALLTAFDEEHGNDLWIEVLNSNRFALTMNIEFQVVFKDAEDKDVMRATGYLSTPQKIYVSLGRNNCKWQLHLFDPDYAQERTNEEAFEVPLTIQEGVKLVKENDKWVSYPYTGPPDMKTVFPSIRIDFCNNGVKDSALMDVIRYSDQDLASASPGGFAKKYTLDMQEYVNMIFVSAKKTEANRDAVIDISDEIIGMSSGTTVEPTGYTQLDKMQMDYKMLEKQLEMKVKITTANKESASVILFDAVNKSPSLVNKDVNMAGDRGFNMEMRKAVVKLKIENEPL